MIAFHSLLSRFSCACDQQHPSVGRAYSTGGAEESANHMTKPQVCQREKKGEGTVCGFRRLAMANTVSSVSLHLPVSPRSLLSCADSLILSTHDKMTTTQLNDAESEVKM